MCTRHARAMTIALTLSLLAHGMAAAGNGPQYKTRYDRGTYVMLGSHNGMEVRLSATKDGDLRLMLLVVNNSKDEVTFNPQDVVVEALASDGATRTGKTMKVYSANQYRSKVEDGLAWKRLFTAFGNIEQAEPERYDINGASRSIYRDASDGSVITEKTAFAGSVVRQPTEADRWAARDRALLRVENQMAPHEEQAVEKTTGLMEIHTIDPGKAYGGVVYARARGKHFRVIVPLDSTRFVYDIHFATSAESQMDSRNMNSLDVTLTAGAVLPNGGASAVFASGFAGSVSADYFVTGRSTLGLTAAIDRLGVRRSTSELDGFSTNGSMSATSAGLRFTRRLGDASHSSVYIIAGSSVYAFEGARFGLGHDIRFGAMAGIGCPIRLGTARSVGLEILSHHLFDGNGTDDWYLKSQLSWSLRVRGPRG
jgi:hypothetical protein